MGGVGSGRKPAPCGTTAKYHWHRARNEDACDDCKRAMNDYRRQKYLLKKKHGPPAPKGHRKRNKRLMMIEEKLSRVACLDCGLQITRENYFVFDFDHRIPSDKAFTISGHYWNVSETTLRQEMAKCDVVCANCHRMRTHKAEHHLMQ